MEEATRRLAGLTEAEAARRRAARGPVEPAASSRSYRTIVRANVLTVFNLILLVFGLVTLAVKEMGVGDLVMMQKSGGTK